MEMKIMSMMMKEKAGVNDILADRHGKKRVKVEWMDGTPPPLPSSFLNVND